jgi:hypothetical protein
VKEETKKKILNSAKLDKGRQVPLITVLGLLVFISVMIWENCPVIEFMAWWKQPRLAIIIKIWFYFLIMIVGLKKVGIFALARNLLMIAMDSTMSLEEKIEMIKIVVQQWIGVLAELTDFVNAKKKVEQIKEKMEDEIEEISDDVIETITALSDK